MKVRSRRSLASWRPVIIAGLLVASIALVAVLAFQAVHAYRFQRRVAEGVLRDYARVAADELVRRTSVAVGYRGYWSVLSGLRARLEGREDPVLPAREDLPGDLDARGRPARELVRTLFLMDPGSGEISFAGPELEPSVRERLLESVRGTLGDQGGESDHPFQAVHLQDRGLHRTLVYTLLDPAGARGPGAAGFEVDLPALKGWLDQIAGAAPLLPASLGEGAVTNDRLSVRVRLDDGRILFASGPEPDPELEVHAPFGDTYSGAFDGMTVIASIPREAAASLIIGGLPRSRLPLLLGLLLLTVGLLAAAIDQLRRERALARMRSEFVSRVSHELRTPLTQIRMFAETLLLDRTRSGDERRRSLEIIDQEARRLGQLVENILQFSRGDRGAIRLAPRPVQMVPILRDVAEKFRPVARSKRAGIVLDATPDATCLVDDDALRQVILNLLDNAVKYGPEGQEIRLGLQTDGRTARISVEDQGPGVPPGDRERIWDRWQRLERDEKAAVAGTGIGLTVVRDLVALQGGRSWVEEGDRGGARFVVEFPVMGGEPVAAVSAPEPEPRKGPA